MSVWLSTGLTLLIGFAGGVTARRLNLPGGAILWSLLAVAAVRLAADGFVPLDARFRVLAQILIGTALGSILTRSPLKALKPVAVPVLIALGLLLATAVACGFAFAAVSGLPLLTTLFSTSPGGATDMTAAALQFEADAALIAGFHLIRQVVIFVVLVLLFTRMFGGETPPANFDDT